MARRNFPTKPPSKGCGALFFGVFLAFGAFFALMIILDFYPKAQSRFWTKTPATIYESAVVESTGKKGFEVIVHYGYEWNGQPYEGRKVQLGKDKFDAQESQQIVARFSSGTGTSCYVNPNQPTEAVLIQASLKEWFVLIIPGIFILVGLVGIYFTLTWKADKDRPISARKRDGVWGIRIFFLIFFLVGSGISYPLFIRPWLKSLAAKDWPRVPCAILSSRVESHRGSKGGTTYSILIRYRYEVGGKEFFGDRYNFSIDNSSASEWRYEAVRQNPAGKNTYCLVNPEDPTEAVISSEMGSDKWFGLIPGAFAFIGLWGLIFAGRSKPNKKAELSGIPVAQTDRFAAVASGGPTVLTPTHTPKKVFFGLLIFGLVWNGIIAAIIYNAGKKLGGGWIVIGIFALIGIGIMVGVVHQFLAMFNPVPTVTASTGAVALGDKLKLDWRFTGDIRRLKRLRIHLLGYEKATYRRGTDTITDTSYFINIAILDVTDSAAMINGEATIEIPASYMHSFDAPNNKVVWFIQLHGDVPKWPDVSMEFPLTVLPRKSNYTSV